MAAPVADYCFAVLKAPPSTGNFSVSRKRPLSTIAVATTVTVAALEDTEDRLLALVTEKAYHAGELQVVPYAEYRKRRAAKKRN